MPMPSLEKILKVQKRFQSDDFASVACREWLDVRGFGQVFAFKAEDKWRRCFCRGERSCIYSYGYELGSYRYYEHANYEERQFRTWCV